MKFPSTFTVPSSRILMFAGFRSHAAAYALVPVVALVGEHAASVVAGAALTEALFGWPGLGYLVLHASLHRDYPLVTATFIVISSGVVLFNAATDVACAYLDPRITLAGTHWRGRRRVSRRRGRRCRSRADARHGIRASVASLFSGDHAGQPVPCVTRGGCPCFPGSPSR
jgi:hypothetical protein